MWPVFARVATAEREILKSRPLDYYFPFIGGSFPYNGEAPDITLSSNTIWNDAIGWKQVGVLTINAGVTLKIERTPFVIFADEIIFGGTNSIIDGNGPSGAASGNYPTWPVRGGTDHLSANDRAQGGCGGIFLIICANRISGANGVIRCNGGNGWAGTEGTNSTRRGAPGQGCFGSFRSSTTGSYAAENFQGAHPAFMLGDGGTGQWVGVSGGTGGASPASNIIGGGSGVGGGGSVGSGSGQPAKAPLSINSIMMLYMMGCRGGGGGAAMLGFNSQAGNCRASGGGGGLLGIFVRELLNNPTRQANGGFGNATFGGAGVVVTEIVPF